MVQSEVYLKAMSPKQKDNFNYEHALERLEQIYNDVQQGKVPLNEYESILKEAQELVKESRAFLRHLDETIQAMTEEWDEQ